ncbi:MAG: hypothetical protein KA165_14405 [Saprospiraceae bacterium]|nr:hypothetical protein [Saprospiraceae bacterium]
MKHRLFLLPFLALFLASCDPGQSLSFENKTSREAGVTLIFDGPNEYFDIPQPDGTDTLHLQLAHSPEKSKITYDFGIGFWTRDNEISRLMSGIRKIELNSWKETRVFTDSVQIRAFLTSRLKGEYKERIEIVIE